MTIINKTKRQFVTKWLAPVDSPFGGLTALWAYPLPSNSE